MTRQEFRDNITTWDELERFCYDYDIEGVLEDVYNSDSYYERFKDDVEEWLGDGDSIQSIQRRMDDYPTGHERYILDYSYGYWTGSDSGDQTFEDFKDSAGFEIDEDAWDEEEPEEDLSEEPEVETAEPPLDPEDFDILEAMGEAMELSSGNLSIERINEEIANIDGEIAMSQEELEEAISQLVETELENPECSDEDVQELFA